MRINYGLMTFLKVKWSSETRIILLIYLYYSLRIALKGFATDLRIDAMTRIDNFKRKLINNVASTNDNKRAQKITACRPHKSDFF